MNDDFNNLPWSSTFAVDACGTVFGTLTDDRDMVGYMLIRIAVSLWAGRESTVYTVAPYTGVVVVRN